jgi:hypothetical protein
MGGKGHNEPKEHVNWDGLNAALAKTKTTAELAQSYGVTESSLKARLRPAPTRKAGCSRSAFRFRPT